MIRLQFSSLSTLIVLACTPPVADNTSEPEPVYADSFVQVNLPDDAEPPFKVAIRACAGLKNREVGGSVYINMLDRDAQWLTELGLTPAETIEADAFLDRCVADIPACIPYAYTDQQMFLPNILTAGTALGAIPIANELGVACNEVAFDAETIFAEQNTPLLATQYVYERFAAQTDGFAMLNPGYATDTDDLSNPPLSEVPRSPMIDFVFSERLFTHFLINGCSPGHPEYDLLYEMVNSGLWSTPIGVYGYNNSWLVGGYLHEAQTRCLESRNMGAIPTEIGNLSFFSKRRPPIAEAGVLQQNPRETMSWDAEKTYVSFVVGDGDNVRFIMSTRNVWIEQHLAACAAEPEKCAPVTWSMSPQLPTLAPDVLEWYYALAAQTGKDYFTLPPSGDLYAYPTALAPAEQDTFVAATNRKAQILDVSTTVHWDWFEDWDEAQEEFLPRYAEEGVIQGIIPVNVPYLLEPFPDWDEDQFYDILQGDGGGKVVLFRQRQWRGINDSDEYHLPPSKMAAELGSYPRGTVMAIYMTSDGGLNLENSVLALIDLLPEHVELVSADTATRLALEASE